MGVYEPMGLIYEKTTLKITLLGILNKFWTFYFNSDESGVESWSKALTGGKNIKILINELIDQLI